ncbi:hypothetical protein SBDP1_1140003 [Syntrophobacter sp. SbD1]|nr:hypothetical protein SBDP1_1140003 [Syntrophobacter sp. SbD1]
MNLAARSVTCDYPGSFGRKDDTGLVTWSCYNVSICEISIFQHMLELTLIADIEM